MPIPDFDHNNVTPPHIGDPSERSQLSPYLSDSLEFVKRFATSHERVSILSGLLKFRKRMNELGIIEGFQWLDGSFTENVEITAGRPPRDLDIVTFYNMSILTKEQVDDINDNFIDFYDFEESKINYGLDHYPVNYFCHPLLTIDSTRYWLQLFSHNRLGIWKGIIKIELNTPEIDKEASEFLSNLEL